MNREIKFRAWDKKRKKMFPVIVLTPFTHPDIEEITTVADFAKKTTHLLHPGEFELMQFTGLKDKNDAEIYEGDIVSFADVLANDHVAEVVFVNGSFALKVGDHFWSPVHDEPVVFVGTVFENPELLK